MKQKLSNFEVMIPIAIGTPQHRNTGNGVGKFLKLCILIWMLMKVDVGWGQLAKPNLIQNPDFTVNSGCSYYWESFYRGCVNSWFSSNGSAHHISWDNNQCFDFNNTGTTKNCLFSLQSTFTNPYIEAIFQPLNIIRNNFITYDVAVQLNLIRCDNQGFPNIPKINARANLRFANGLVNSRETFTPIQGFDFQNIGSEIISSLSPVTISFLNLTPDRMFNNVQIFVDLPIGDNEIGQTFLELVNLNVNCNTSALDNIVYNNETQKFEAINANPAHPFVQYRWQLPDNIVSTQQNPIFDPQQTGKYNICLEVLDVNGCKGSLCKEFQFIDACDEIVEGYEIKPKPLMSRRARLSELLADTECPLEHVILPNGTIRILNKYFYLTTDLIVDVKCEFERTNWFCAAGTLIDVQNDMTIKHSEFQSCDEMWKGFKHQYGKILRINDSSVKDAEFGVEASGNARFYSTRSVFQDCYTGVRFPGSGSTQSLINNFFKTKFIAETNLKNPYPGQAFHSSKMYYGIWIENIAELNVTECQFINLGYSGIQSKRSNIRCQSSKFKDDGNIMRGVVIDDSGPISHFQLDTFENNYIGIINDGLNIKANLRVNNNNLFYKNTPSSTIMDAIFIRRNTMLSANIIGNVFDQNSGSGVNSRANNKLLVESNTFLNKNSGSGYKGVNFINNNSQKSIIRGNNLYSHFSLNIGANTGFDLSASSTLTVTNNNFYNISGSTDLSDNISVEGVLLSVFRNNNFFNKSTAFKIQGVSNNNMFCCNTSTEPGNSIDVIDKALGDYRNNNLHTIRLSIGGEIGQQPLPGNRWQDNNGLNAGTLGIMEQGSQMKAQSNQIATDPSQGITNKPDIVDPVEIEDDWFYDEEPEIMSTCVSNPLCKDVGQYVGGGGNGGGSNNEEYNPWDPPIGDPPRRPLCDKVMENYFNYYTYSNSGHDKYPHQTKWNINDYLLDYINIYGQSFFDSCIQNSVIWITPDNEAWYDGEKDKQNIYIVSDPYKSLSDDMLNDADSISNEIYYLTDSVLYDTDTTVLQGLYDELAEITDDIKEISDDIHLLQKQRASDFLQNIPNLPEPHSFLTARKKVWTAEVKCFLYGESSVTPQEWAEIREIMLLCPYEAGKVVTEAKSLLLIQKEEVHEYNYNACQSSTPRTTNVKNSDEIFVYPNPGKNTIHVSIPDDEKIQFISIKNVHGSEVLRLDDVIVNNQSIDVSLMSPGLYFYEIKTNDTGKKYHGKLILVE